MKRQPIYRRKGFWIAAVLVGVLILGWFGARLALRAYILAHLPPPVSLYSEPERVRKLFWSMMDAMEPDSWWGMLRPTKVMLGPTFNSRGLKGLQRRFGDMPEFWQLMYVVSEPRAWKGQLREMSKIMKKGAKPSSESTSGHITFLERAVEVAPEDATSLFLLARTRYDEQSGEPQREEQMIESLRHCIELDPEQATYHYELARHLEMLGEQEEALAELALGNAASKNDYIDLFPFSYIRRNYEAIDMRAGGLDYFHLYGWMTEELSGDMPNYIRIKDFAAEIVVAFNLSGDATMLTTFHRYGARLGQQRGATSLSSLAALPMLSGICDGAADAGLFEAAAANEDDAFTGVRRLEYRLGEAKGMAKSAMYFHSGLLFELSTAEPGRVEQLWLPSWAHRWFRNCWKLWQAEMGFLEDGVAPAFAKIEKFDYTDPAAFAED